MHADREHVISVVLDHEDWKEFVKLQPQPVDWLRERIQEMINSRPSAGCRPRPPATVPSASVNSHYGACPLRPLPDA